MVKWNCCVECGVYSASFSFLGVLRFASNSDEIDLVFYFYLQTTGTGDCWMLKSQQRQNCSNIISCSIVVWEGCVGSGHRFDVLRGYTRGSLWLRMWIVQTIIRWRTCCSMPYDYGCCWHGWLDQFQVLTCLLNGVEYFLDTLLVFEDFHVHLRFGFGIYLPTLYFIVCPSWISWHL